jgi:hypothetical protein
MTGLWGGRLAILQTAKVLSLACLLMVAFGSPARAQASGRLEVSATVVDATASRSAMTAARWLSAGKSVSRRDLRLATVVVNRERRRVAINFLKN